MTLVCSVQGVGRLLTVSDILLSIDRRQSSRLESIWLPLKSCYESYPVNQHCLVGTAQKAVIFGSTMILWSGFQREALSLVRTILEQSNDGINYIEMLSNQKIKNELSRSPDLSLIYHFNDGQSLHRSWRRCSNRKASWASIVTAGSGGDEFLYDRVENAQISAMTDPFFSNVIRALNRSMNEICTEADYDSLFGGWMEFCGNTTSSFKKISYAIKVWEFRNGKLYIDCPLFFSSYDHDDLIVCQVSKDVGRIHGSEGVALNAFRIQSLMKDVSQTSVRPYWKWHPCFIAHIIVDKDQSTLELQLEDCIEGRPSSIVITGNSLNFSLSYSDSHLDKIFKRESLSTVQHSYRLY